MHAYGTDLYLQERERDKGMLQFFWLQLWKLEGFIKNILSISVTCLWLNQHSQGSLFWPGAWQAKLDSLKEGENGR